MPQTLQVKGSQLWSGSTLSAYPLTFTFPEGNRIAAIMIHPTNVEGMSFVLAWDRRETFGNGSWPGQVKMRGGDLAHVPTNRIKNNGIFLSAVSHIGYPFGGAQQVEAIAANLLADVEVTLTYWTDGEPLPPPFMSDPLRVGDVIQGFAATVTALAAGSDQTIFDLATIAANVLPGAAGSYIGREFHLVLQLTGGDRTLNDATAGDFPLELIMEYPDGPATGTTVRRRCISLFPGAGGPRRVVVNLPTSLSAASPVRIIARNPTGADGTKTATVRGWLALGHVNEDLGDNSQVTLQRTVASGVNGSYQGMLTVCNPKASACRLAGHNGDSTDTMNFFVNPYIPSTMGGPIHISLSQVLAQAPGDGSAAVNIASPFSLIQSAWTGTPDASSNFGVTFYG